MDIYGAAAPITPVTPNSTNQFTVPTKAIFVGANGNIKVLMNNMSGVKSAVTFKNVPTGTILRVKAYAVYNSNTAASSLVALW